MSELVCCKRCGRDTRDKHGYCGECRGEHSPRRERLPSEMDEDVIDDEVQEMVKHRIERMIGNSSD